MEKIKIFTEKNKVGLGISRINADSQWNPVYNVIHRIFLWKRNDSSVVLYT